MVPRMEALDLAMLEVEIFRCSNVWFPPGMDGSRGVGGGEEDGMAGETGGRGGHARPVWAMACTKPDTCRSSLLARGEREGTPTAAYPEGRR